MLSNHQKKGKNYYPLCSKCQKEYPLMIVKYESPLKIILRCQCNYEKEFLIKDYIAFVTNTKSSLINIQCQTHNSPYVIYCCICKTHFCEKCQHSHNVNYSYQVELKEINIQKIQNTINECNDYINKVLSLVGKKYHLKIGKKLLDNYEKFKERNKQVLFLIQILINSYSEDYPNYYIEQSIKNNTILFLNFDEYYLNRDTFYSYDSSNFKNVYLYYCIKYFNKICFLHPYSFPCGDCSITALPPCYLILTSQEINLYNTLVDCIEFTIDIKYNYINSLPLDNENILSYFYGGYCIISYKIEEDNIEYCEEEKINYDLKYSRVLLLSDNRVALSGELVFEIEIRKLRKPYDIIKTLKFRNGIFSEYYYKEKNKLLIGTSNYSLTIWNMTTYQIETVFENVNYSQNNLLFQMERGVFLVGNYHIVDLNKYTYKELDSNDKKSNGLTNAKCVEMLSNGDIVTCSIFKRIIITKKDRTKCVELTEEKNTSTILNINNDTFITYSNGSCTIWKY